MMVAQTSMDELLKLGIKELSGHRRALVEPLTWFTVDRTAPRFAAGIALTSVYLPGFDLYAKRSRWLALITAMRAVRTSKHYWKE
jgi:hypothetical protein